MLQDERSARRRRVISIVIVAALLWLGVCAVSVWYLVMAVQGRFREGYARISISPQKEVWLHFKGDRAQFASTAEGLKGAKWMEPQEAERAIALPLEGEKPQGWEKVEISVEAFSRAKWRLSRKDAAGAEWTYAVEEWLETGGSPEDCPTLEIPKLEAPKLEVRADPQHEAGKPAIGIGVKVSTEDRELSDIYKNGETVKAQARLLDSTGKVVASIEKPLSEFGFG